MMWCVAWDEGGRKGVSCSCNLVERVGSHPISKCPAYEARRAKTRRQAEGEENRLEEAAPTTQKCMSQEEVSNLRDILSSVKSKISFKSLTQDWSANEKRVLTQVVAPSMTAPSKGKMGPPTYTAETVLCAWLNRMTFGTSTATSRALQVQWSLRPSFQLKLPSPSTVRHFWAWTQQAMFLPLVRRAVEQVQAHQVHLHLQYDSTTLRHNTGSVLALMLVCWAEDDSPIWARDLEDLNGVLLHPEAKAKDARQMVEWLTQRISKLSVEDQCKPHANTHSEATVRLIVTTACTQ
jgi:hypothetical protein